ncbi:unnamed protein product [Effrenium voratum]|nr:unnamed protein product [Effrenium voratum]
MQPASETPLASARTAPRRAAWETARGTRSGAARGPSARGARTAWALLLARPALRAWRRVSSRGASSRGAVTRRADQHSRAVQRWLQDVVIGLGFCPWAAPAEEDGGIRIVTSSARNSQGVFEDVVREAEELWQPGDASRTTLLVCPFVEAWNQDFRYFHAFYNWYLDAGFGLAEQGIKVVPFHPHFAFLEQGPENGDYVQLPGPDGQDAQAQVLERNAGKDEAGEFCMAVQFDSGEKGLIRHASVLAKPSRESGEQDLCQNFTSRSPRPVLHLLRIPDLARAERDAAKESGEKRKLKSEEDLEQLELELDMEAEADAEAALRRGQVSSVGWKKGKKELVEKELQQRASPTQAILERNEFTTSSLGHLRLAELLENCG